MARTTVNPGARKLGEDELLNVRQVAALLGVGKDIVYGLKDSGHLPYLPVGKKLIKFWRSDVQRYADLHTSRG